jgi:hypothetical protein
MKRRLVALLSALLITLPLAAQENGETVWVRAFQDTNNNGSLDSDEPLLTGGVSASLVNASGVTIATALLDESPNVSQGLIGFAGLMPGDYTLIIASPELTPTRGSTFEVTISTDRDLPLLIEYGGQPIPVQGAGVVRRGVFGTALYIGEPEQVTRTGTALLAALFVAGVMTLFGFIVYLTLIRPRLRRQYRATLTALYPPPPPAARTSAVPAVPRK